MRRINAFLFIGIIGVAVFGSHFGVHYGRAVWGNRNMWWTPTSMALPISGTRHHFELYVGGELLQNHLDKGSLFAIDAQGESYRVAPGDIEVRLNNWQEVKSSMLHSAVFAAFMLGISAMALVVGVKQFVAEKKTTATKETLPWK